MTKRFRHIVAIFSMFFFILVFSSCKNDITEVQSIGKGRENVEEGTNVKSILSLGGIVKAQLTAPYMIRRENDSASTIFPKSLFVTFYNDSTGIAESFLKAKYGKYFVKEGKVLLRDSVVFTNIKGDTMRTSELWWNQNSEEIFTDKKIWFYQKIPYSIINANGFKSSQDFSRYYFTDVQNSLLSVPDTTLPSQ